MLGGAGDVPRTIHLDAGGIGTFQPLGVRVTSSNKHSRWVSGGESLVGWRSA